MTSAGHLFKLALADSAQVSGLSVTRFGGSGGVVSHWDDAQGEVLLFSVSKS